MWSCWRTSVLKGVLEMIRFWTSWSIIGGFVRVTREEPELLFACASFLCSPVRTFLLSLAFQISSAFCEARVRVRVRSAIDWHGKNVISGSSFYSTCIDCHRSLYHLTQLNYANWMAQWHGEVAATVKWDAGVEGSRRRRRRCRHVWQRRCLLATSALCITYDLFCWERVNLNVCDVISTCQSRQSAINVEPLP